MTTVLSDIQFLDPAEAGSTLSAAEEDDLAGLFANWEMFSQDGNIIRPISPLALKLLSLDEGSSTPGRDLAKIIESDPILTAQWLRGACKHSDPSLIHGLWLEYLITAHCARELAKRLPDGEVDGSLAYAAGLLHDVGTIALVCAQPEPMSRFLRTEYDPGGPLYAGFVTAHTQLGAALLRRWRAPAEIATVAARHHSKSLLSEAAVSIAVFLADHLHLAVLDHDRAGFENPEAYRSGCFGGATEQITSALTSLGIADELDVIVGRVAAECRSIELLATAIYP